MEIRTQVWNFLVDSKTNEYFSSLTVKYYQKLDLCTNIFLVLATSSSIAAWAIWKEYPLLWTTIIGLSQIMTLAKPYFLFPKYIKVFNEKSVHWQHNALDLEELWHKLNNGIVEETEITNEYFELKKKSLVFDQFPEDIIFFDFKRLQNTAENQCNIYIKKIS